MINGVELSRWVSYQIDSDLLTPADAFSLQVDVPVNDVDRVRELVAPGAEVQVYIERTTPGQYRRALQMTGWIDERHRQVSKTGGMLLTVSGRDKAGVLCDASVDPNLRVELDVLLGEGLEIVVAQNGEVTHEWVTRRQRSGVAFIDLVRAAVQPWSIPVITDDAALRSVLTGERVTRRRTEVLRREARAEGVPPTLYTRNRRDAARAAGVPLDEYLGVQADSGARFGNALSPSDVERIRTAEARPHIGETVWDFLDRHARRLGLMMWMTADGRLVIGSPDYGQPATYRLIRRRNPRADDPNTIIDGGVTDTIANRYSSVRVFGRSGNDETRTRWTASVDDPEWTFGFTKPLTVKDQGARSDEAVRARGHRALALGKEQAFVLDYTMGGHGQRDAFYAQGTVAYVCDEPAGVSDNYYVTKRTFTMQRASGTYTQLRLVPLGSIVLRSDE